MAVRTTNFCSQHVETNVFRSKLPESRSPKSARSLVAAEFLFATQRGKKQFCIPWAGSISGNSSSRFGTGQHRLPPSPLSLYPRVRNRTRVRTMSSRRMLLLPALAFTLSICVFAQKKQLPPPPAHARQPSPGVTDEFIHKQFGDNCHCGRGRGSSSLILTETASTIWSWPRNAGIQWPTRTNTSFLCLILSTHS